MIAARLFDWGASGHPRPPSGAVSRGLLGRARYRGPASTPLSRLGRGGRPLRIAYARIFHEANAFSPVTTDREHFERFHFVEGDALAPLVSLRGHELKGFLRAAELSGFAAAARLAGGVTCVPLLSTFGISSGPLTPECFEWLREQLRDHLARVGEVDGVYLAMHGSMRVKGLGGAPEQFLIGDANEITGGAPLAASYDLHANLSPGLMNGVTILDGYRTNPHRDLFQTGMRAGTQLIRALRGHTRPVRAWRKLPMVLGGGTTIDFLSPMRPVFRRMRQMARDPRVVGANLFMVHPFSDADDLGWASHIATDGDEALADQLADELAELAWQARTVPLPEMRTPSEAIADVRTARLSRATGHVSLVDMGDVVGTGSPGGNTRILDTLVREASDLAIYLPLHDPAAIEQLWDEPIGDAVDVVLRGTVGLDGQPEVALRARVVARETTDFGRTVALATGELRIAVTEQPPYTLHPRFWKQLGLSPWHADAIVQKALFHYRVFYAASSRRNIPVVTPGPSSLDNVTKLAFDLPVYPQQDPADWRTFDRLRRSA